MSDVSVAPEQDAIAESLLGEPEEQQTVEQSGTEQPEALEQDTQQVEAEQTEGEEAAEDWLPDEQSKVFPPEVLERYAPRYGFNADELQSDPRIARIVQDKLNTDIFARQLQDQLQEFQAFNQQEAEQQEGPTPEQQAPQAVTPEQTKEWLNSVGQYIQTRTDPQVAQAFHADFLGVWNLPPEQQPMAFATVAGKYMVNLMHTALPDILQKILPEVNNQVYPDFNRNVYTAHRASTWDQIRNSDPRYESLPSWGTKEFAKMAKDLSEKYPAIEELGFSLWDKSKGGPVGQGAMKLFQTMAKLATTENSPQQVQQLQKAAAAGASNARRAAVKRSAGNLGSGQSANATGRTNSSKFQTNQDIFDDETMEMWNREHGRL